MSKKPRVRRTPEEKWQIVTQGLRSGNTAETCRKYEIAQVIDCRSSSNVPSEASPFLNWHYWLATGSAL